MTNKPKPGEGDVEFTLAGEKRILKPSLRAIQEISRLADGVGGAMSRVQKQDFNTIVMVVVLGMGLTENGINSFKEKHGKTIDELIFEEGTVNLAGACARYLTILANGGKPLGEAGDDANANPTLNE